MTTLAKDGSGTLIHLKSTGEGTLADPKIQEYKETSAVAILAAIDGIEALETTGNASLVTITGHVDGIETAIATTNSTLSAIDGRVDGLETLVGATNTALAAQATAANQTAQSTLIGAVTETAPANDTASSGLNGRLQRVAQLLTTLLTRWPAALGGTTSANSLPVSLSTDGPFANLTGALTETAPATDTASSGLNGRLQRIAQRLTSLIALIPSALTGSGNFKVAVQEALPAGTNNIGDVDVLTLPDTRQSWRVSTLSFTAADDSDNTFTVPATTEYQILSVYVSLVTTATVGNRQMAVQALDSSDNILIGARAGTTQAASLTRVYNFAPGLPQDTAFRDTDYLAVSIPSIFLTAGQKLSVWDKAAVAAAADDMTVRVQIASRSIA